MRISIGQFSKMTRLSLKALRLYHDCGLLVPAFVDPGTGYRYYELQQAGRAEVIRLLRSVDMPLEEILVVVSTDEDDQIRSQLLQHRERLRERLAAQKSMLNYLDALIEDTRKLQPYEVELTQIDPEQVAAVRVHTSLASIAAKIASGFQTLVGGLTGAGIAPTGPPLIVYHDVIDDASDGDLESVSPSSTRNWIVPMSMCGSLRGDRWHRPPIADHTTKSHRPITLSWVGSARIATKSQDRRERST